MSEEDKKEQQPKKYALITLSIWDDGEMEVECVKYEKTGLGRGAPKKVIKTDKKEFMDEVDIEVASKFGVLEFIRKELKIHDAKIQYDGDAAASKSPLSDDDELGFD